MAIGRPGSGGGGYGPGPKLGPRVVSRPLTKAEKAQNKSAETYKTVNPPKPRSEKQRAADAALGKRTKAAAKAKSREPIVATGAAVSLVANAGLASDKKVKPYGPPANKSVKAAAKKQQAKKKK